MIQTPVLQTHRWLTQSHDGLVDFVHVCCPIDFIETTPIIKSKPVLKCLHDQGLGKAGLLKTKWERSIQLQVDASLPLPYR